MADEKSISMAVIRRLPKYHRYLRELIDRGVKRISSQELSDIIGFTASQIRQDLNNFGGFGQQGYGYNVEALYEEIRKILGLSRPYNTIIIGAGNLGQAIANYTSFASLGFNLRGIFDINPKIVGMTIAGIEVRDLDEVKGFISENRIEIAYICTSRSSAQSVAEMLVDGGVKAIWNFAPVDLKLPKEIAVENVHLVDNLMILSYFIKGRLEE
jgi:redox-sensing transcriptional repressor